MKTIFKKIKDSSTYLLDIFIIFLAVTPIIACVYLTHKMNRISEQVEIIKTMELKRVHEQSKVKNMCFNDDVRGIRINSKDDVGSALDLMRIDIIVLYSMVEKLAREAKDEEERVTRLTDFTLTLSEYTRKYVISNRR